MKLTVLCNDEAKTGFEKEHGLSLFLEIDDKKILFDTGATDVFVNNAHKLNIHLKNLDAVVLSHGHWDHGNGLKYLENVKLVCHPGCFERRFRKQEDIEISLPFLVPELKEQFELVLSKAPYSISEKIIFLGEIPRENSFEGKYSNWYKENKEEDFVMDDSGMVIITEKGLVVIAGCSHAGICNIIEYAKKVTGVNDVYSVIGGFHLLEDNEVAKKTLDYFEKEGIRKVYPLHCTCDEVIKIISERFQSKIVVAGDQIGM